VGKIKAIKTNFNGGELTKQAYGRVDLEVYQNANKQMVNCLPTIYGSATKRGGTKFVTDNIKHFYKTLQEITGASNINCVSIDWKFNHYVFGCNDGYIAKCDFDFDNVVIQQVAADIGDIKSIAQGLYWNTFNRYHITTDDYDYIVYPQNNDWTNLYVYRNTDIGKAKVFDLAKRVISGEVDNPPTVVRFNGKILDFINPNLDGSDRIERTFTISDNTTEDFDGFYIDDNNFLLRNETNLFWYHSGEVTSLGTNTGNIVGAKVKDGKIYVGVDKTTDTGYAVCWDIYDTGGTLIKEQVIASQTNEFNVEKYIKLADKELFVCNYTNSFCVYRGKFFWLDFYSACLDFAVKDDKVLYCNGGNDVCIVNAYSNSADEKKAILIPFKINKNINYVLEFGDHYIRFYKDRLPVTDSDGAVYEISSPYSISDLIDNNGKTKISWTQCVDVLYLCHKSYPIQTLKRYGNNNWIIEEFNIKGGVFDNLNTDNSKYLTCAAGTGLKTVNAVGAGFSCNVVTVRQGQVPVEGACYIRWFLNDTQIIAVNNKTGINEAVNLLYTYSSQNSLDFTITSSGNTINVKTAIDTFAGKKLSLIMAIPNSPYSTMVLLEGTFNVSAGAGSAIDLFTNDDLGKLVRLNYTDTNTTMWEVGKSVSTGNIRKSGNNYYIAKNSATTGQIKPIHTEGVVSDGAVNWEYLHSGYGVGQIIEVVNASQVRINVDGYMPDFSNGTYLWELGLIGKDGIYPNCCAFFKERFVFAISTKSGTKICASCAGDYNNFSDNSFGEVLAENAITVVLQGKTESEVLWMIPGTKLYIGTDSEEFIFGEQTVAEVLSPTNVSCSAVSALGSAKIKPLEILDEMLFVSKDEKEIANFTYVAEKDSFRPVAISVLFEHLLHNGVKCWDWTSNPHKAIWFVDGKGNLRTVVYDNEQKVIGATRHNIDGTVESLCVIPEPNGNYDDVWILIKRTVDGKTERYIEYFSWGLPVEEQDDNYKNIHGVFCDCAKVFEFTSEVSEVSGLYWLENETVDVIVDGKVQTQKTVVDGTIQLDKPGKVIVVGLDFGEMLIETLHFNLGGDMGTTQGSTQRVNKLMVRVIDTCQLKAKATGGNKFDTFIDKDNLQNGDFEICSPGDYSKTMTITLKNDKPVNCCVCALIAEFATNH
jgi:hypothetical protein